MNNRPETIYGIELADYERLKSMGVSHGMMKAMESDQGRTIAFYKERVFLGKSLGEVPTEHQKEVLDFFEKILKEKIWS